jgi:hypothetical protein
MTIMRIVILLLVFPILVSGQTNKTLVQDFLEDPRYYSYYKCEFQVTSFEKSDGLLNRTHSIHEFKVFDIIVTKIETSVVNQKDWPFGTNLFRIEYLLLRSNSCIKLKHDLKIGDNISTFINVLGKDSLQKKDNQLYELLDDTDGIKRKLIIKTNHLEKVTEIQLHSI